jgi:uncharacterized protein (DUF2267 family)
VNYSEFIASVAKQAGVETEQAKSLTKATLETLAERLTAGEADDLAAQLPLELKADLQAPQPQAEAFGASDFIDRVARRASVDADLAVRGVQAVFATLRETVSKGEFDDVLSQLPQEFEPLVGASSRG